MKLHKTQHYLKELPGEEAGDICEFCDKASPTTKLRTHPYKRALYDDYTKYLMCDECAYQSSMDI